MTVDHTERSVGGGYWPCGWPVECGGNHRPKTALGRGLGVRPTDRLVATTRHTGRWPVMFVRRDPGELYLCGNTLGDGATAASWVERVDPTTLAPLDRSGDLPTGDHEWCGSIAVHANGDLYMVSGSHLHRLDRRCAVVRSLALPVDHAHNGLLVLGDGSIVTKDLRLGPDPSTVTVLDPDLEVLTSVTLPEPSMGRIAAVPSDRGTYRSGGEDLYLPGATRVFRLRWDGRSLELDDDWQPTYRDTDRGGLAWDSTIADGRLWLHDNGNTPGVELRFSTSPTQRFPLGPVAEPPAPAWTEPVRLIGIPIADPGEQFVIRPTELPGGWVIAPPLVSGGIAVAWDTGNTGLAAFDVSPGPDGEVRGEMLWFQPFRSSMQPLLYPDTGELVTNDFRYLENGTTSDDLVVLDLATGRMKARVATGATRPNGMFLTPGVNRDLYYCTFETVARVRVESL
ncbi:MAG: hypothetical protein AAGA93_27105 [Actinomycetota bacterium]